MAVILGFHCGHLTAQRGVRFGADEASGSGGVQSAHVDENLPLTRNEI